MLVIVRSVLSLVLVAIFAYNVAYAQERYLQPKYGTTPPNAAQQAADKAFIASIDEHYKGNRKKASQEVSARGWQYLRQGNMQDAMKRFNQAWLLDAFNGVALWGMAAIQGNRGQMDGALKLFAEAERLVGDDIDFSVDHAKVLGMAAAASNDKALLQDAFARFARLYEKSPQHVLNLQNWAVTLFYIGNYSEAWKKVKLAEAAPRRAELSEEFIAALQNKMPRP